MRTTLSCSWCRKSKVKCSQHHGDLPCRRCQRSGRTLQQCVLQALPKKARSSASRSTPQPTLPVSGGETETQAQTQIAVADAQAETGRPARREWVPDSNHDHDRGLSLVDLPRSKLAEALEVFQRAYPGFCMVHHTDTIQRWDAPHDNLLDLKVSVILALCAGHFGSADAWSCFRLADQQTLTSLQNSLWPRMMQRPDIDMVQCLLLISQLEWGRGNAYAAWMCTGNAIRMFQALEDMAQVQHAVPTDQVSRFEARETVWRRETTRRTYWTCFLMDRMLACSGSRPSILASPSPTIPLPSSEDDWELGIACESPVIYTPTMDGSTAPTGRQPLTIHNHFEIVIRSLDLWSHTCRWVAQGGRRQPSMRSTCPWETSSPWYQLVVSLEGLREMLHPRMRFPETPVTLYMPRRQGERFALNNLIYYCTIMVLYREYLPFVPEPFIKMAGPTELPLLIKQAPDGWWASYTTTLFDASAQVTAIFSELTDAGITILSPIIGYCAFTAASMNLYLAAFPWVDPASSQKIDAAALSQKNLDWLRKFAQVCPLGHHWVQVAEQTQDFYRKADPANTWSCNDYPSRLRKTLESYGSLSASPEDGTGTAGQSDYGTPQQPHGDCESGRWRSASRLNPLGAIDAGTTDQPDRGTQQQQPHISASAARVFEHHLNGVYGTSSSGDAVAAHQGADMPAGTPEDSLSLDWSYWGLQNLFPQDPGPIGNELQWDWFH